MAVRKAVSQALMRITGEPTAAAAVVLLKSALHELPDNDMAGEQPPLDDRGHQDGQTPNRPTAADPEVLNHSRHDGGARTGPAEPGQPQDGDEVWPTLPVWVWLEADEGGTWQAHARLGPPADVAPVRVQAPVSRAGLTRLWFPILTALKELEAGGPRPRSVPVWLWFQDDEDEPAAWFSFERVVGVKSTLLDIPSEEQSLAVMREGVGKAMVWLTGCETPDAAARELTKLAQSAPTPRRPTKAPARRRPKSFTKRRTAKVSARGERKMVIPRIRVVSGGLPGLGKRR
jgi:hypothetical protein